MSDLLYVVTHGLISLVRKKDGSFDALMIPMDDHRYLAGTWLNERPIDPGEFQLTGVSGDPAGMPAAVLRAPELDPTRNVILPVKQVPGLGPGVRTIIHLPKPIAVHSYFKGDISESLTGDQKVVDAVSKTLSGVQVLVYSVPKPDDDGPSLQPHPWTPVPGRLKTPLPAVSVLHLFNEPPEGFAETQTAAAQEEHNKNEFQKGAAVLGFKLGLYRQAVAEPSEDEVLLPGLKSLELQPLVFREKVANKVVEILFSADADPGGTDPATCNPPHGDGN